MQSFGILVSTEVLSRNDTVLGQNELCMDSLGFNESPKTPGWGYPRPPFFLPFRDQDREVS